MNDARKVSLKDKIKQFLCFSCCFSANRRPESTSSACDNNKRPLFLAGASSQWIKTRAPVELPEIKDKCRRIFGRIGGKQNHRRRHSSTDFRYDPLSYSLNFQDDSELNLKDDTPLKDFSSRLPSSPPPSMTSTDHRPSLPHPPTLYSTINP